MVWLAAKAFNVRNSKKWVAVGIEHQIMLLDFLCAETICLVECASKNRFFEKLSRIHGDVELRFDRKGLDSECRSIPRGRKIPNYATITDCQGKRILSHFYSTSIPHACKQLTFATITDCQGERILSHFYSTSIPHACKQQQKQEFIRLCPLRFIRKDLHVRPHVSQLPAREARSL